MVEELISKAIPLDPGIFRERRSKERMMFVITQFWVIPQKSPFFKIKIKNIK
jgi:hypothetical protein